MGFVELTLKPGPVLPPLKKRNGFGSDSDFWLWEFKENVGWTFWGRVHDVKPVLETIMLLRGLMEAVMMVF